MKVPAAALACLLWAAGASPLAAQAGPRGTLSGRVTGSAAGDTVGLPHALIQVLSPGRSSVTADETGRYSIPLLPTGPVRLRVAYAGLDPLELEVLVPAGDTLRVDLHLLGGPVDLGAIDVRGDRLPPADSVSRALLPRGIAQLEVEAMRTTTGLAEVGLVEAARRRSGNDPADPTRLLLMRGSTADLKLVLLDGAPVHTPFHLGGLMDPVQAGTVGRARLFLGGAPARYNGGLSHILDIETRRPESEVTRGEVAVDLMGVSGVVEKRVGPAGILVAGRSLHNTANGLLADGPEPYGYYDALVRGDLEIGDDLLSVTVFSNEESVNLDPVLGIQRAGLAFPASGGLGASWTDAAWSNMAVSARYQATVGRWTVDGTAARTDYSARLPVGDTTLTLLGGTSKKSHFALDLGRGTPWGSATMGISLDDVSVEERSQLVVGRGAPAVSSQTLSGQVVGGYVEGLGRLPNGVALRTGLRGDVFQGRGGSVELSPRVSVLWPVSEGALFRIAAGRFTQFARRSDPAVESDIGIQGPLASSLPLLAVARATHLVASLDQALTPRVTAGLEGFVKSYSGLPDFGDGRVNASGMDLRLAGGDGVVDGWLGYTLTWFWSDSGAPAESRFTGHHLLTAGLEGPLSDRIGAILRFSYGSGLPFTSVPLGDAESRADAGPDGPVFAERSPEVPVPDESFLRLDLTLSGSWQVAREGRRAVHLSPYIRILNALEGRDALFHYFDPWRPGGPRPLAELPLLPIVGLRVTF